MRYRSIGVVGSPAAVCWVACLAGLSACSSSSSKNPNGTAGFDGAAVDVGGGGSGGGNQDAAQVGLDGGRYPLPADTGQTGFLTWTYNGQPVGFYLPPATGKPLPVVMFLHGCTNNPVNPNWWIIDALNKVEPCAVLLPFRPADESPTCSAWGGTYDDGLRPAMIDALAGLDAVTAGYGLDSKRQYLYGESMGAEGVLQLLVQFPTRFAGAVVVAGYTVDKGAEQMAQTPLWLIHGSADTTSGPKPIEDIYHSIVNLGGTLVKLTEYPGLDHSPAIVKARSEPGLLDWLLAQRHDGLMRGPVATPLDAGADGGTVASATVTITMTALDAAYEGKPVALALLPGTADCNSVTEEPAYAARGTVAGGACEVSIPLVPAGLYTACAFIDADGNARPSPGDLANQLPLVISGDTKETWSAADWTKM